MNPRHALFTDNAGIWRQDQSGPRLVIAWNDIYRVSGTVINGITKRHWFIELDWSYWASTELSMLVQLLPE